MIYNNKIAIIIRSDLKDWQKMNVVACLSASVAIAFPEVHGDRFVNASGSDYLPFMKNPVLIYAANSMDEINRAFRRGKDRELAIGIYTEGLFATKCAEENHLEISKTDDDNQVLAGIILYCENKKVNKALDGLKLHS